MRRRTYLAGIWILLLLIVMVGVVSARELIQGEACSITADEVIKGSLFTFCQELVIDGRIEGNIIGIALRTTINGEVTGNLYVAGLQMDVYGSIAGDVHYAGISLNIHPPIKEDAPATLGGQLLMATLSTRVESDVNLSDSINGVGYQLIIMGNVSGEVNYWGSALRISSHIDGDVYATVGNSSSDSSDIETLLLPLNINAEIVNPGIILAETAMINGSLSYTGPSSGLIDGIVTGRINYSSSTPAIIPITQEEGALSLYIAQFAREFTVLMTIGLLGLLLLPNVFQSPISNLRWRPVPSFVIGMLMFIVSFPISLILLLLTLLVMLILALLALDGILLVIGSLLGLFDFTLIGVFYFVAIFVARAVFCMGLGRFLVHLVIGYNGSSRMNYLSLLVGVILMAFLTSLPAIGFLFNAAALFMGLGAIMNVLLEYLQSVRDNPNSNTWIPRARRTDFEAAIPRLPAPGETSAPDYPDSNPIVGMENLPDGFDVDFFFDEN